MQPARRHGKPLIDLGLSAYSARLSFSLLDLVENPLRCNVRGGFLELSIPLWSDVQLEFKALLIKYEQFSFAQGGNAQRSRPCA